MGAVEKLDGDVVSRIRVFVGSKKWIGVEGMTAASAEGITYIAYPGAFTDGSTTASPLELTVLLSSDIERDLTATSPAIFRCMLRCSATHPLMYSAIAIHCSSSRLPEGSGPSLHLPPEWCMTGIS